MEPHTSTILHEGRNIDATSHSTHIHIFATSKVNYSKQFSAYINSDKSHFPKSKKLEQGVLFFFFSKLDREIHITLVFLWSFFSFYKEAPP